MDKFQTHILVVKKEKKAHMHTLPWIQQKFDYKLFAFSKYRHLTQYQGESDTRSTLHVHKYEVT